MIVVWLMVLAEQYSGPFPDWVWQAFIVVNALALVALALLLAFDEEG